MGKKLIVDWGLSNLQFNNIIIYIYFFYYINLIYENSYILYINEYNFINFVK